jgi:hypothetical protein
MHTRNKKPMKRRILNFGLGLTFVILVPVLINLISNGFDQFKSFRHFVNTISYGVSLGLAFWLVNWFAGRTTGKKLNWRKNPKKANLISLLTFISLGMIISFTIPYIFLKYIWDIPPDRIVSYTVNHAFICFGIDMLFISIFYSHYLAHYYGESIKNEEELKRENLIARYEALKNQVNPHFLFNTLNTLTGVVEKNPEKA